MRITARTRFVLRAQSIVLLALVLGLAGLAAWASITWTVGADWSYGRNSLTPASRRVLAELAGPATITAFVTPHTDLAESEHQLLSRYAAADSRIRIRFVNPDLAPAELQKLGITTLGELYVGYGGRGEKLMDVSESGITNALLRLARGTKERVTFVTGHGEVDPEGKRNYDLGDFGRALAQQGFELATRNLATSAHFAPGTALVVVAGAQQSFLPGEVATLKNWIAGGGNFLWLRNPGPVHGLAPLAATLGVKPLDGTVVDMTSRAYGVNDPTALIVSDYGTSAITRDFRLNTLLPDATGFETLPGGGWHADTFLASRRLPASWLMTGGLQDGKVLYRPGTDVAGPVPIGIALTRPSPSGSVQQRAVVIGDVNFLDNSYLGNGGNLNLGLKLFNWLTGQDRFVDVSLPQAPDRTLSLSRIEQGGIGLGFLAGLPLVFLATAIGIWLRRRRR